ncbi:MAG: hypothetical protein ACOCUR_00295 [Nanoarchaeota archaeon]
METKLKKVSLKETKKIELPTLDITPYVGKMTKVANVEEYEGRYGYFVKVETETLDTIEIGGEQKPLTASKILGLHQDKEGNIGWGEETKLGLFLKKMNVPHYKDLVGKEVQVQKQTSKEGQDFLTIT